MKKIILGLILSASSFSMDSQKVYVDLEITGASISNIRSRDSVLELSIQTKKLDVTPSTSNFPLTPNIKCIHWATRGTSPDNPGVCDKFEQDGWYIGFASFPAFTSELTIKNLTTNAVTTRSLPSVILDMFPENPSTLNQRVFPSEMEFKGQLFANSIFGCAVNDSIKIGKEFGEDVYVNICASSTWPAEKFNIQKNNESFSYALPRTMTYEINFDAFMIVRDYPRTNMVRKNFLQSDKTKALTLVELN